MTNAHACLHYKVCRVTTSSYFSFRGIVILQVLVLNLQSFQKMLQVKLPVKVVLKSSFLKKNKSTHYFLSGPPVFPCCFSPFRRITAQLKCNVIYGPISMKERFQFRLYNPQMHSNIFTFKSVRRIN